MSSPSVSPNSFKDWSPAVLERYWPHIGDSQVKSMALKCVETLFVCSREIPMMLEHDPAPIRFHPMKRYTRWFELGEV